MTDNKFRHVKDILTLLKFTSNQYRSWTTMYRISFERPCIKTITATYMILNMKYARKTTVNTGEFHRNR